MTGEISLRGLVLPVGGIKEKTSPAVRAGLKRVVLPARNKKDLEDVSEDVRSRLEFTWAGEVGEVLDAVLEESPAADASAISEPDTR
jgi:ATP-dependent Lon protease